MTPSGTSDSRMDKCPVCKGRGYWETWTYRGHGKVLVDCWDCDATGRVPACDEDSRQDALTTAEGMFS